MAVLSCSRWAFSSAILGSCLSLTPADKLLVLSLLVVLSLYWLVRLFPEEFSALVCSLTS